MIKHLMIVIGFDLGDKYPEVFIVDQKAELLKESRVSKTQTALKRKFSSLPHSRVALEVRSHFRWVSHLLNELGHEGIVADTRKFRLIHDNPPKQDRTNADEYAYRWYP